MNHLTFLCAATALFFHGFTSTAGLSDVLGKREPTSAKVFYPLSHQAGRGVHRPSYKDIGGLMSEELKSSAAWFRRSPGVESAALVMAGGMSQKGKAVADATQHSPESEALLIVADQRAHLEEAIADNNLTRFIMLAAEGAADITAVLSDPDPVTGDTLLHVAASKGCLDIVRYYVIDSSVGAGIMHHQNKKGETPLHCAIKKGFGAVALLLIEHSDPAAFSIQDCEGQTPLHCTINLGDDTAAHAVSLFLTEKLLVRSGPDALYLYDGMGHTPLHRAVMVPYVSMIELLLIYVKKYHAETALYATHEKSVYTPEFLAARILACSQGHQIEALMGGKALPHVIKTLMNKAVLTKIQELLKKADLKYKASPEYKKMRSEEEKKKREDDAVAAEQKAQAEALRVAAVQREARRQKKRDQKKEEERKQQQAQEKREKEQQELRLKQEAGKKRREEVAQQKAQEKRLERQKAKKDALQEQEKRAEELAKLAADRAEQDRLRAEQEQDSKHKAEQEMQAKFKAEQDARRQEAAKVEADRVVQQEAEKEQLRLKAEQEIKDQPQESSGDNVAHEPNVLAEHINGLKALPLDYYMTRHLAGLLFEAIAEGNHEAVKACCAIPGFSTVHCKNQFGNTPLMVAAQYAHSTPFFMLIGHARQAWRASEESAIEFASYLNAEHNCAGESLTTFITRCYLESGGNLDSALMINELLDTKVDFMQPDQCNRTACSMLGVTSQEALKGLIEERIRS